MPSALERYERSQGWTVLTQEQKATVHNKLFFGHSKQELLNFADRHDIYACKSWTKGEIADAIVHGMRKQAHEYDIILSMVTTPSSYLGGGE